jgi:hypothetical protein
MLRVFSEKYSERLKFTLDFIFKARNIDYVLTFDKNDFFQSKNALLLNYSEQHFPNVANISPANLLFEKNITEQQLSKSIWENNACFSFDEIADPIASIFFVLSRYEEYTSFKGDKHQRFCASNSVLKENDWLLLPICDVWSEQIISFLQNHTTETIPVDRTFRFIPTFDIDNTYAFLYKSKLQLWGGRIKDWLKGDSDRLNIRKNVLSGKQNDPFDTFTEIVSLQNEGYAPIFFWHLGNISKYDRNISSKIPQHQQLIYSISQQLSIGIHPSYSSNKNANKIGIEKKRLASILKKPVVRSRQHFLKLQLPITYRKLIKYGIQEDYSMGFSDHCGFRAGTARPFLFFDLQKNSITQLTIHPFVYMDGTLHQYMRLSVEEAKNMVQILVNTVKQYGGDFICIWHNETIAGQGIWKNWKQVFLYTKQQFNP